MSDLEAELETAIDHDDPATVAAALAHGAKADGLVAGGTALGYAIGTFRACAARALIRYGADPNRRDTSGNTAVSLAVDAYERQPGLLQIVLAAGGDPNTRGRDGSPVVVRFIAARDLDALERMKEAGADQGYSLQSSRYIMEPEAVTLRKAIAFTLFFRPLSRSSLEKFHEDCLEPDYYRSVGGKILLTSSYCIYTSHPPVGSFLPGPAGRKLGPKYGDLVDLHGSDRSPGL